MNDPCVECRLLNSTDDTDLCPLCWVVREIEAQHVAGQHEDYDPVCRSCTRLKKSRNQGFSHANCPHPKTLKERAKCRKINQKNDQGRYA